MKKNIASLFLILLMSFAGWETAYSNMISVSLVSETVQGNCLSTYTVSENLISQTIIAMTVSVTDPGDCTSTYSEDTFTVTNANFTHKVDVSSSTFGLTVKVNGVTINNYTPGTNISGLENGDEITVRCTTYPNPFGPPCPTSTYYAYLKITEVAQGG